MLDKAFSRKSVPVWDIPVRLFHWLLVGLVVTLWYTAENDKMDIHMWCGYAVFVLVLFRLLWGIWGSQYARFSDFIYGFSKTFEYTIGLLKLNPPNYVGHNPLGGWSVFFMLAALLVQTTTGLFTDDEIFTQGPLTYLVSSDISQLMTTIHKINFKLLLILIATHISAVLFYFVVKRENLIRPMFTGRKWVTVEIPMLPFASLWRALFLLALVCGAAYLLIFIKWQ